LPAMAAIWWSLSTRLHPILRAIPLATTDLPVKENPARIKLSLSPFLVIAPATLF
jgi:hypothetical protein